MKRHKWMDSDSKSADKKCTKCGIYKTSRFTAPKYHWIAYNHDPKETRNRADQCDELDNPGCK